MISIQIELGGAYCNLANAVRGQGRPADSLEPYGRAAEVLQRVLDKQPSNTTARLFLRNTVWGRAQSFDSLGRHAESAKEWGQARDFDDGQARDYFWMKFAEALGRSGDHERAAAETDSLAAPGPSSETLYGMARILSICTVAAKDQPALAAGYANRVIDVLRRSQVAGFFDNAANVARLRQDSTFDPLRDRDDFRQFVTELSTIKVEEATKNP
jgi:tetratricopeptide (TPR) repeat protein